MYRDTLTGPIRGRCVTLVHTTGQRQCYISGSSSVVLCVRQQWCCVMCQVTMVLCYVSDSSGVVLFVR